MVNDWYRNTEWNADIEQAFQSKLKRARTQKFQYLVIQALTLVEFKPEIALSLVDQYFESREEQFEDVRALLARANALMKLGRIAEGMAAYRSVLAREDEFPKHQTTAYVDYPYEVATRRFKDEYANAMSVLNKYSTRLMFPLDYFKWHASKALINEDGAQACAALEAAKIQRSGFRFHQNVGLVGKEHQQTIRELNRLCT